MIDEIVDNGDDIEDSIRESTNRIPSVSLISRSMNDRVVFSVALMIAVYQSITKFAKSITNKSEPLGSVMLRADAITSAGTITSEQLTACVSVSRTRVLTRQEAAQ
jgi:hypothetical protein